MTGKVLGLFVAEQGRAAARWGGVLVRGHLWRGRGAAADVVVPPGEERCVLKVRRAEGQVRREDSR